MVTLGLCHSNEVRPNTTDRSKNISKIGILFAGEELHHNHHLAVGEPFFSYRKDEFDIGFFYLTLLNKIGLAKLRALSKIKPV
jgi:stearoyl-CoA desaturase (delta-9 desaturase)